MISIKKHSTNCIVVCGPTASGKTHLAVTLANRFQGEIISADSRQVYRGMDIGTGKDLHEYTTPVGATPVHLIDIVDPSEVYTVYQFKQDFFRVFNEIGSRNHMPVLAGGTGLYIESVLRDFTISSIPENVAFRESMMLKEKELLSEELLRISPAQYSKTDLSSKKRIVRALEIAHFSELNLQTPIPVSLIYPIVICTKWDRTELYKRIDCRLCERLELGMIDEVKGLLDAGVPKSRLVQFGMEYKHIVRYLSREIPLEEMITVLSRDIHRLAKRQETWFRGMERRGVAIHWIDNNNSGQAIELLEQYL